METVTNPGRRKLFKGNIHVKQKLRLPWVVSEEVFTQKCNQCLDCINVCESQIITRDEQGFPIIDFSKGECSFCRKCIDICQPPLFKNDTLQLTEKPWPITVNISEKCLAKNSIYCQSCRDECPTNAIDFSYLNSTSSSLPSPKNKEVNVEKGEWIPTVSSIPQPTINTSDCTQCGACISSCPQAAISVNFHQEV